MSKDTVDLSTYKVNMADNLTVRLATFLVWLCGKKPHIFIAPNIACKAINGYKHTPQKGSDEVAKLRSRYGRVRAILRKTHKKDLIVEPGIGMRASVDDADVGIKSEPKYIKKFNSARAALVAVDSLVDWKKVPKTAENMPFILNHNKNVGPLLKEISTPTFLAKLLPPVTKEDEDEVKP